jgi:hypothetical protein
MREVVGRGEPRHPSRIFKTPARESLRWCWPSDKDFSRPPKNHDPGYASSRSANLTTHQHAPPRSWDHQCRHTMADKTRPAGTKRISRERETVEKQPRMRDPPPPPCPVTVRTQQHDHTRPIWPDRDQELVKLPSPRLSTQTTLAAVPSSSRSFRPTEMARVAMGLARPNLVGPQKGLYLSQVGAATSRRTTQQPSSRVTATNHAEPRRLGPREHYNNHRPRSTTADRGRPTPPIHVRG